MDTNSSYDISEPSISLGKSDKAFNFFMFIILIIIFFIIVVPWDKLGFNSKKEGMSGGTLTQLMAQDSQDVYLKSNVDKLATGNFDLYWNQPTRVANTFMNRGTPLPSIYLPDTSMNPTKDPVIASNNYTDYILNKTAKTCKNVDLSPNKPNKIKKSNKTIPNPLVSNITSDYLKFTDSEKEQEQAQETAPEFVLPDLSNKLSKANSVPTIPDNVLPSSLPLDIVANSNPYELASAALKSVVKTEQTKNNMPRLTDMRPIDYLYQDIYNRGLYDVDCIKDPSACGGGAGSQDRLNSGFIQPTRAKSVVDIDGTAYYPDSYLGSMWYPPDFDISRPLQFMPKSNLPPNMLKMG
jgi:hypothetical protein